MQMEMQKKLINKSTFFVVLNILLNVMKKVANFNRNSGIESHRQ